MSGVAMYGFEGKTAIVSGAAKGIGKACALRFAREGCRMIIVDVAGKDGSMPAEFAETLDEIKGMGNDVEAVMADVSKQDDVDRIFKTAVDAYGTIDYLVNVAGVGLINTLDDVTEEEWDWTVDIDMKGIFLMDKASAGIFKKQGYGKIVNMSSINGVTGADLLFPYNAAKAGVINLTQSFARHLGPYGVNVNAVCPGFVWTPMWTVTDRRLFALTFPDEEYEEKRIYKASVESTCLKRPTLPEDIAKVVAWLCSDEASEVTGQHINVDGGVEFH
jgi:NAD(P)-dependent dehydrogenase (short-subunit alcohol dehydrogenase family)